MNKIITLSCLTLLSQMATAQNPEDFADVTNLPGWSESNQSNPLGVTDWIQGNSTDVFNSHQGAPDAYLAANFNNTTGATGVICNFQILPDIDMVRMSFYTRSIIGSNGVTIYPDRLRVRYSPTGGVNVGDCTNGFGDFTDELIVINPDLLNTQDPGSYPIDDWTEFETEVPGDGRIAFVYHVTDAGPSGSNSNYIGIDTVSWLASDDLIFEDGFE